MHAGLTVTISVDYTPPPNANLGPNEYRAGSGPVTVTCIAQGGTGSINYQWSSTCSPSCLFSSSTSSQISEMFIRASLWQGTHTCTVTRGSTTRSVTVVFNVVGECLPSISSCIIVTIVQVTNLRAPYYYFCKILQTRKKCESSKEKQCRLISDHAAFRLGEFIIMYA